MVEEEEEEEKCMEEEEEEEEERRCGWDGVGVPVVCHMLLMLSWSTIQ